MNKMLPNVVALSSALLILFVHLSRSAKCVIDNRSLSTAWEEKLRRDLLSCHNRDVPPNMNKTVVAINFKLKSFYFDDKEEIFTINTWVTLSWHDSRLTWNSDNYGGINEVLLSSLKIWTPQLKLYNSGGVDDFEFIMTMCHIINDGRVSCIPRITDQTVCSSKLNDWPYDKQNCTFKFGSKSNYEEFTFNSSRGVRMFGAEYGPGWTIIDYSECEDINSTSIHFSFSFVLEREGVGLAAIVVVPSLVLSFITVLCMSLNVEDKIRLSLLCFGLLNQFFFLQEINSEIPKHSAETPTVLLYLRSSVALTLCAIGITFLLTNLYKRSTPPPNLILTLTEKIFGSYARYLIWPRWNSVSVNENSENAAVKVWADLASGLNFISMLLIAFIYIIMFYVYIPKKPDF